MAARQRQSFLRRFVRVALALSAAPLLAAASPSFEAKVSASRVVIGDSFTLTVNARDLSGRGLSSTPRFSVPDAAPMYGPATQVQSSFVNGQSSSYASWKWTVLPTSTGVVHFGEVWLEVPGGSDLRAQVPDVVVVPPPQQPWVRVSLHGPETAMPQETFLVRAHVDVMRPSGTKFADVPVVAEGNPKLDVSWLFGNGIGDCADLAYGARQLEAIHPRNRGAVPPFDVTSLRDRLNLSPALVPADDSAFVRYEFKFPFRAVSEGDVLFDAVRFSGSVVIVGDDGKPALSPYVVALSEPLRVRVVPPPAAGRPASYAGVLATRAEVATSLDIRTCRQGDPLRFAMEVSGDFDPSAVRRPDPFADPAMAALFRQWGEPERSEGPGTVRFEWKVRAIASGTVEVPPVEFSWYDPGAKAYATARSAPLPLRVEPVRDFDPDALFAAVGGSTGQEEESRPDAPPALTLEASGALPVRRLPVAAVAFRLIAPPTVFLFAFALPALRRRVGSGLAAAMAFGRRGRALSRLRAATSPREAAAAAAVLAVGRRGRAGAGFGADDLRAAMLQRGAPQDTADEASALLRGIEQAAYRPGADSAAEVATRRVRLAEILAALKSLVVVAGLGLFACGAAAAQVGASGHEPVSDSGFRWREACAAAAAPDAAGALAAARMFREIAISSGGGSGPCLRNLGAVLLVAGRNAEAADAFNRAIALEGETPEARAGAAAAAGGAEPWWRAPALPLLRISLRTRENALSLAWAALWLLLALRRLAPAKCRRLRGGLFVCAAAAAICAAMLGAAVTVSGRVLARPFPELPDAVAQQAEDIK